MVTATRGSALCVALVVGVDRVPERGTFTAEDAGAGAWHTVESFTKADTAAGSNLTTLPIWTKPMARFSA
jgi:hypothetical protein